MTQANVSPIEEPDVYAACKAFILTYALPALEEDNVIQGWQNRASLPPGTEEYAVVGVLSGTRRGTTLEEFDAPDPNPVSPGILTVKCLVDVKVQVDFCSASDDARLRAQRFAAVIRSSVGVEFFNAHGMSVLYAEDVNDHSFVGDAGQFVRQYSVIAHLVCWSGDRVELDWFNQAAMTRVEDVSVHHHQ